MYILIPFKYCLALNPLFHPSEVPHNSPQKRAVYSNWENRGSPHSFCFAILEIENSLRKTVDLEAFKFCKCEVFVCLRGNKQQVLRPQRSVFSSFLWLWHGVCWVSSTLWRCLTLLQLQGDRPSILASSVSWLLCCVWISTCRVMLVLCCWEAFCFRWCSLLSKMAEGCQFSLSEASYSSSFKGPVNVTWRTERLLF